MAIGYSPGLSLARGRGRKRENVWGHGGRERVRSDGLGGIQEKGSVPVGVGEENCWPLNSSILSHIAGSNQRSGPEKNS